GGSILWAMGPKRASLPRRPQGQSPPQRRSCRDPPPVGRPRDQRPRDDRVQSPVRLRCCQAEDGEDVRPGGYYIHNRPGPAKEPGASVGPAQPGPIDPGPPGVPLMSDVTRILSAVAQGDPHAASQLLPLVYDELRRLAAQKLAHEQAGQTLSATA